MLTRRPEKVSDAATGLFESKGSSLGLKTRNSKLPCISSHLSAKLITISSMTISDGENHCSGSLVKVKVEASRLRVPGAGFLPDTLYVAEAKRPFGGARNL